MQDSSHSGVAIPGFAPISRHCSSYCELGGGDHVKLGRCYPQEELGLPARLFAPNLDAYYEDNYCHAEYRGVSAAGRPLPLFMRPSFASKHVLQRALQEEAVDGSGAVFWSDTLKWGYHGTPPSNLKSVLDHGLRASSNGVLGPGLYFTPSPLYAQLYSSVFHGQQARWRADGVNYWVDTAFQIRYPDLAAYGEGLQEYSATVGADYSLHELFATARTQPPIEKQLIACIPPQLADKVRLQAIIVKLHRSDPYTSGGEWQRLQELVRTFRA